MTIHQLKNFLIVSETLNFRKATEQIHIAQPALSRQIQMLEEDIGALLFDRSKKQIRLTPAGKYFREEALRIVTDWERIKQKTNDIHKGRAGKIQLGHATSAMQSIMPSLVKNIKEMLPDLMLVLEEETNREVIQRLLNRQLDFGLIPNAVLPPEIDSIVLYRENFVLIAPGHYALDKDSFQSISQYRDDNWILPPRLDGHGYLDLLGVIFKRHGFQPKVAFESPNATSVLRMISAGLGLTIIGKSALNGLSLDVSFVELDELPEKVEMRLLWLNDRSEELKEYCNLIMQFLKQE